MLLIIFRKKLFNLRKDDAIRTVNIFSLSLFNEKKRKTRRTRKERKKGRKRGKKDQNTENERTKFAKVAVTRKTALEKKQKKKKKNNRIYRSDVENVVLMTERCGGNVKKKRHLASIYIYIYIFRPNVPFRSICTDCRKKQWCY